MQRQLDEQGQRLKVQDQRLEEQGQLLKVQGQRLEEQDQKLTLQGQHLKVQGLLLEVQGHHSAQQDDEIKYLKEQLHQLETPKSQPSQQGLRLSIFHVLVHCDSVHVT